MLLLTGQINSENWNENNNKTDFFVLKEKVEHILFRLGIDTVKLLDVIIYALGHSTSPIEEIQSTYDFINFFFKSLRFFTP